MIHYNFSNGSKDNIRHDILKNPVQVLNKIMSNRFNFGVDNISSRAVYREMGWAYDFREYLRKFVYQKHGQWSQIYALNKANVRLLVGGRITKILEVI